MNRVFVMAAVFAALAAPAMAGGKGHWHKHHGKYKVQSTTIVVSCYRGPWKEVIWDRPNAVFVDSLVAAGYSFPEAHAIGERVCRDTALVGQPGALKEAMLRIYHEAGPRRHKRRYKH